MKKLILLITCLFTISASAQTTIACTSFEDPKAAGGNYTDTGDANSDHALVNNPGEPLMNHTMNGMEMGFSSFFFNTGSSIGMTDGDEAGVTAATGRGVGSYPDGSQGLILTDIDGLVEVSMDEINVSGFSTVAISADLFVFSTTYESSDSVRIYVIVDGTTEMDLLNTSGLDIDDLALEGNWTSHAISGLSASTIEIRFSVSTSASAEGMAFDNIRVEGAVDLPVELVAFDAMINQNNVDLTWETASEDGASHFEVQSFIGDQFETIASIETAGAGSYSHNLNNLSAGGHSFRLKMVDVDGAVAFSSVIEVTIDMPTAFELSAAYPNPFNPETRFAVTVVETQNVAVEIFNALGQKVATLHNGQLTAGTAHNFTFTANNLPSGLYLYRATGENFVATRTLSLVK